VLFVDLDELTNCFHPRLALASMSGQSDVEWACSREESIGAAFLGAFNLDEETLSAARDMVGRGRDEFLPETPFPFFREQIEQASARNFIVGGNVRTVDPELLYRAGRIADQYNGILEINAHCRQPEMENIGCGQGLLRDKNRLREMVQAGSESGALISVKGRFEVEGVDSVSRLNRAVEWGATILHVDAMDSEKNISYLEAPFLIANNGIREPKHVQEYLDYGADAVSVGRAQDHGTLSRLSRFVAEQLPPADTSLETSGSSDDPFEDFSFDEIPRV